MQVILVRHAQAILGQEFRFAGHNDVPLTHRGKRQAALAAQRLATLGIDCLYSSDTTRALQTATICSEIIGVPVSCRAEFRETDVGQWEGRTLGEVQSLFPEDFANWKANLLHYRRGGGESLIDVQRRALRALHEITKQPDISCTAVVCHAGTIRATLYGLDLINEQEAVSIQVDSCSFTTLLFEGRQVRLLAVNDKIHMAADEEFLARLRRARVIL